MTEWQNCKECGYRVICYIPLVNNCFPTPTPFEPIPNHIDYPISIPSTWIVPSLGPTTLELAKVLRECFKKINGRVPTGPLDQLIEKYETKVTVTTVTTVAGKEVSRTTQDITPPEQLDMNHVTQAVKDIMSVEGFGMDKIAKFPPEPPKGGLSGD